MHNQNLNLQQQEAVLHREGPMLVTAGPGSGKTYVITARLLHMIQYQKIPPEKIMVITFTKEAAVSMSKRFRTLISGQDLSEWSSVPFESVSFGTFHSLYYQILKSIPLFSQYRLIYEKEKKVILSTILCHKNSVEQLECYLSAISYYKNTLNLQNAVKKLSIDEKEFLAILHAYDTEKQNRQCMDFDDMLYLCWLQLSNNVSLLDIWQDKFDYYLVDEFQDCNPIQYQILRILTMKKGNLFAVGDDDQAIYGFRGAEPGIMRRFLEDYPQTKQVTLGVNYRSVEPIVKASAKVISDNEFRIKKDLRAANMLSKEHSFSKNRFNKAVVIREWSSKQEMHQYIVEQLAKIPKEELSEHAVLFRTNQEAQMFAIEMIKNHISFHMKDKNESIYEHFLIKDIMAFMKAAEGDRSRKIFLRILNKPRTHIGREALDEMVDFERIKAFYQNPYMNHPEAIQDAKVLEHNLECLKKLPLFLGIKFIRMGMHYESYLYNRAAGNMPLYQSWLELLDWLMEDAKSYRNVKEWEEYQKKYSEGLKYGEHTNTERANASKNNEVISLMTMHSAKGLEFEHCYILYVNEGSIPKYQKGQILTKEQEEEERRIFYVGMTRAKKTLELHYLTGTKERPKFPSRFIRKLLKDKNYSSSSTISSNSH